MNRVLYTRVKNVAEFAQELNKTAPGHYDFSDIVSFLWQRHLLSDTPLGFRRAGHFLSPEDFRDHVYSQVVYAGLILRDSNMAQIREENTIPEGKDIFTTVHLPYLDPRPHVHNFFELIYVYDGSCTLFFNSEEKIFHTGDLCILAPDSCHYARANDNSLILSINIRQSTFDKTFWNLLENDNLLTAFFNQCLYNGHTANYLTFKISTPDEYQPLIQQIFDESNTEDRYSNNITISLVHLFFGKLLRNFGNTIHLYSDFQSNSFHQDFPLMLRYIQANYSNTSLSSLAEVFHYSTVHISRMFKKNLNQNFSSVLQTLRLEHAKNYLDNTDYSLSEITEMVGYDSPDHLSRTFKKKYHITPSEYRKSARGRTGDGSLS